MHGIYTQQHTKNNGIYEKSLDKRPIVEIVVAVFWVRSWLKSAKNNQ